MELILQRVDVWAAVSKDKPGGLAGVLAALRDAGQTAIHHRAACPARTRQGVVFVTPLQSAREIRAAAQVGFNVTQSLHSVRVMGPDRPGIAAELTQKLADGGINLRGFSASVIRTQFAAYLAVDSLDDANKAIEILEKA
jgi:predicted amino acid-binding ACT domain protein